MRRILIVCLVVLLLVPGYAGEQRLVLPGRVAHIAAAPVMLVAGQPERRRNGALVFLGGVTLSSRDRAFGGYSAMRVDGDRFTLLSDGGNIARFRLDRQWRLAAPAFAALPDGPGTGWRKLDRDSESLAVDPATGDVWISFERANAIWRFDGGLTRAVRHVAPRAMRGWPVNGGPEAIARMPDGGMIVLAETARWRPDGATKAVRFAADPTLHPDRAFIFGLRLDPGYRPTDAVMLDDRRLLVLGRRLSGHGFLSRLYLVDARAVGRGAIVRGRAIARFEPPFLTENFEAMAVTREGAATILWIASDDNHAWWQRTLLLKFRLNLPAA